MEWSEGGRRKETITRMQSVGKIAAYTLRHMQEMSNPNDRACTVRRCTKVDNCDCLVHCNIIPSYT